MFVYTSTMDAASLIVLFLFGLIIGSFLNVVIYRFRTGVSLSGRSHCTACNHALHWHELVPVCSYIMQRGACAHCGSRISPRYIVVELLTGAVFVAVGYAFITEPMLLAFNLALAALLVVIVVYDIRHLIIPNAFVVLLAVLAALVIGYEASTYGATTITHALLGAAIPASFLAGLWYVSGGRWIGMGDVKLSAPLGGILGAWGSVSFLIFAFWIGAVVTLTLLAVQHIAQYLVRGQTGLRFLPRTLTMKSEVPFAPFLIAAFVLVQLSGADVFALVDAITAQLSF